MVDMKTSEGSFDLILSTYPDIITPLQAFQEQVEAMLPLAGIYINVKSPAYAAIGDGVADDTAAIQAAIDAGLAIGAEIYLPSGDYRITDTLILGNVATNAFTGLGLRGSNGLLGTTITWDGSTSGVALKVWRGRLNPISDVKITSSVAKGTSIGIQFTGQATGTNTIGPMTSRVYVGQFHQGVRIGDGAEHDASELMFIHTFLEENNVGLKIDGFNSLNITILGGRIGGNTTAGIETSYGNVSTVGVDWGANGVDIDQTAASNISVFGGRSESYKIFDGQSSGVSCSVSYIGLQQDVAAEFTVAAATNASPIAVTTAAAHGRTTGDRVLIQGVGGNTAANGPWTIIVTGASTFTLTGSTGNGAYTSGGDGFSDQLPIKIGGGNQGTLIGVRLKGSVHINNGFGGASSSVKIQSGTTPFLHPLDVSDGTGSGAYYALEQTQQVDADGVELVTFNESGTVVGTTLVPSIPAATQTALDLNAPLASPVFTAQITTPAIDGGSAANDDITIQGTSNATRTTSYVNLQPNGGSVGVGLASPLVKLHAASANSPVPTLGTASGSFALTESAGNSYGLWAGVANSGDVWLQVMRGDGTATAYNLLLQPSGGNVSVGALAGTGSRAVLADANGVLSAPVSDARLKTNVRSISSEIDVLASLDKLRGVYFDYIPTEGVTLTQDTRPQVGMIADEIEQVFPEMVGYNAAVNDVEYKYLNYELMAAYLLEVVKAQKSEMTLLHERLRKLEEGKGDTK